MKNISKGQILLRYPARERASWFASWSASSRAGRRPGCRPVVDTFELSRHRFELSRHVEIARTWSQAGSQLVCDQFASWSATC